ncbi:hypothetical protein [Rhizobium phage RHph_X2_26]|nr:hypothetical protein [Rhizobium phage RHph_X2_26]
MAKATWRLKARVRSWAESAVCGKCTRLAHSDGARLANVIREDDGSVDFGGANVKDFNYPEFSAWMARRAVGRAVSLPLGSEGRRGWFKVAAQLNRMVSEAKAKGWK